MPNVYAGCAGLSHPLSVSIPFHLLFDFAFLKHWWSHVVVDNDNDKHCFVGIRSFVWHNSYIPSWTSGLSVVLFAVDYYIPG
jgi:hypothetical protein